MSTSEITTAVDVPTAREAAFITEYQKDKNATRAYLRAGYKGTLETASAMASQVLARPRVAREIARLDAQELASVQKRSGITLEKTLKEIAKGAFYDPRRMFNEDGTAKGINELDDIEAAAIEGFEVEEVFAGRGDERMAVGRVIKVKLAKRAVSLDMLMKHLNGYKAHEQGKGEGAVNALAELLGGMRRSALPVVQQVGDDGDAG